MWIQNIHRQQKKREKLCVSKQEGIRLKENMNTLKLVACSVNGNTIGNIKLEDIPPEERDWNSWWYLHGKLTDLTGYDKAVVINCKSAGYSRETIHWSRISGNEVIEIDSNPSYEIYINGIIPVKIEGIQEECIGYFWTTKHRRVYWQGKGYDCWMQRGLVCLKSDTKGCKEAKKKYIKQTNVL